MKWFMLAWAISLHGGLPWQYAEPTVMGDLSKGFDTQEECLAQAKLSQSNTRFSFAVACVQGYFVEPSK
jgi:hypothetical protein